MRPERQLCPSAGNSAVVLASLAAKLSERGEVQHNREWNEVNGDQHQGKDGHQITCRLNLKCVARRRGQETGHKRISEIDKTKHVPRHNKTRGLVLRSRVSKTHKRCREAYDEVPYSGRPGEETRQFASGVEDKKNGAERAVKLHADKPLLGHRMEDALCRFPSPNHERADQNRQQDAVLNRRPVARSDMEDAHGAERDCYG